MTCTTSTMVSENFDTFDRKPFSSSADKSLKWCMGKQLIVNLLQKQTKALDSGGPS